MSDSSVDILQTSVETFDIKVMPGKSPHIPRVRATWRDFSTDGSIELDSLRTRTLRVLVDLLRTNRLTRSKELTLLGEHLFVTLFGPTPDDDGPRSLFMKAVKAVAAESSTELPMLCPWLIFFQCSPVR